MISFKIFIMIFFIIFHESTRFNYGMSLKHYVNNDKNQKIYYDGQRFPGDRLDYSANVKRNGIDSFTWKRYIHYPHEYNRGYNISYMEIVDSNYNSGFVTLVSGGVGYRRAVVLLMSSIGQSMCFKVNIFTRSNQKNKTILIKS